MGLACVFKQMPSGGRLHTLIVQVVNAIAVPTHEHTQVVNRLEVVVQQHCFLERFRTLRTGDLRQSFVFRLSMVLQFGTEEFK